MLRNILRTFTHTIAALENPRVRFGNCLLTFFFAVTLRNFLEMYSDNETVSFTLFAHYYLSYICLAMALIILFRYAVGEPVETVARVVLPCFIVLLVTPVVDLILSGGDGWNISYLLPGRHDNLITCFFTLGGPWTRGGASPGIRLEIGLVVAAAALYFYIKTGSRRRGFVWAFLTYCLIFLYGTMPFIARKFLGLFLLAYAPSDLLLRNMYLLLVLPLGAWLLYLYRREYFSELLDDLRFLRILHYELLFVLGAVFAASTGTQTLPLTRETIFYWPFTIAAIACAGMYSLITNNLADIAIDRIANPARPSVTGAIPEAAYKKLAWLFLLLAATYALAVHFTVLFFIVLLIGNYYLYSMPPLRLKRTLFVSKFIIALNSLIAFILGYFFISSSIRIPWSIAAFFLICLTAALNVIDIKDYAGDRDAGIRTLPTVLGLKTSKLIIGLFLLLAYPAACLVLQDRRLITPLALVGIVQFCLITRKAYHEKPVLILHVLTMLGLSMYLLQSRQL